MESKEKKRKDESKLGNIIGGRVQFRDVEEILQKNVVAVGNGAHINIPKKHIGKEVQITIWRDQEHIGYSDSGEKLYRTKLDIANNKKEAEDPKH